MASWLLQNDKANAMRRFQRRRYLENIFHLFNLCAALFFLFSHSSSSQTFSHLYRASLPLFRNSFYAFLLLNAIILFLFLFALSNKHSNVSASTAPREQPRTLHPSHKKIITISGSPTSSPVSEETVTAVTETATTTEGETVSEKKCYRRAQSESFERRMVVAPPRREMKRCNTAGPLLQRRLRCVEQLSEDEFNRAVEDFIAVHKRMQWEEQIGSQKTGYLAFTP